jgi:P-type Cu+ transporter
VNAPLPTGAGSPRPGAGSLQTIRFPVSGMTCGSCVNRITRALRRLDGVDRVRVDLGNELVTVRRDPARANDAALAAAIAAAGYTAHPEAATQVADADARGFLSRLFAR